MTTPTTEDTMNPSDVSATMDAITQVGARVRLVEPADRYPHFTVPAGATGTVHLYDGQMISVMLDTMLPGTEPWDGCVQYVVEDDQPWLALEVERLPNCSPQCAEVRGNQDCPGPTCAYRP